MGLPLANARLSSRFTTRPALRLAKHGTLWLYRVLTTVLLVAAVVVGAAALLVRYWVLPNIGDYRDQIAAAISRAAHQRITIGAVEGRWEGLRPRLIARDVRVYDRADAERLVLASVDGTLSWISLLGEVRFHAIEVDGLAIEVRRDERGAFSIAGIPLQRGGGERGFGDWLLEQHRIAVRRSSLTWIDETLSGMPLLLSGVDLLVDKRLGAWRVGLQASPPIEVAAPIDLRGELRRDRFGETRTWRGRVYLAINYADLAALRHWLPLPPDVERGAGGLEVWADLDRSEVSDVLADVRLSDLSVRLRSDLPYLDLAQLSGRLAWSGGTDRMRWSARNLSFTTPDGLQLQPADIIYRRSGRADDPGARREVIFDALDLAAVVRLIDRLPLDPGLRERLAEMNPRGTLRGFELGWTGPFEARSAYTLRGRFEHLSVAPSGFLPGFTTVSGELDANEREGKLSLRAAGSELDMPKVFAGPLALSELDAQLHWSMGQLGPIVYLESARFSNPDLAGTVSGSYRAVPDQPGVLDVAGSLQRGAGGEGWRYLPLQVNPKVRDWLQRSIVGGRTHDVRFRLNGDLNRFPFRDGAGGLFEVIAPFEDTTLAYGTGWPALEGLRGELAFRNAGMTVRIDAGRLYGLRLLAARAGIADLSAPGTVCEVHGEAEGPSADFLQFIAASPVSRMIGGFTDQMQASGSGVLSLALELPLKDIDETKVSGRYRFAANTLDPGHQAPRVEQLSGELVFDNHEVRLQDGSARVLRMPVRFTAERTAAARALVIRGSGNADAAALRALIQQPWAEALSGAADWQGTLSIEGGSYALNVDSELRGLAAVLPAPLSKEAAAPMRFNLQRRPVASGRDLTAVTVGNVFSAQWVETPAQVIAAEIRLNEAAPAPQRDGIWIGGRAALLDIDGWRALLGRGVGGRGGASGVGGSGRGGASLFASRLIAFDREWQDVALQAVQKEEQWQAQVSSREAAGSIQWNTADSGSVRARFSKLYLPEPLQRVQAPAAAAQERLPALDIAADDFRSGERQFGALVLAAVPEGADWRIRQLELRSPEGTLAASGLWRGGSLPGTRLDVQVDTKDIGGYFARLRLPPGVTGGKGKLRAQLAWNGAPHSVDIASLSGTVKLEAKQGRFVRIEPGLGKLIGVLSLQSLPRRASLDFHDIFSEGFAFDRIVGTASIERGIARTSDFVMAGPSAKVELDGEINLAGETQRLDVRVVPSMSEGVALGAAIVNPAVGLATLLAQKALKDPISQMVAFDYEVSGTWDDPMVMKKRRDAAPKGRQGRD